ncbi:MAG: carboxypeptidase regulatory-like domain-containing protein [Alphaproteobacteria bacterium]|nr:carboxypeptidase regulatory-like domain-containing protein [Alphaproteobacteria bacterium]
MISDAGATGRRATVKESNMSSTNVLGVLVAGAAFACAQTVTGVINGTVVDSSGNSIPGAEVKLTNEATAVSRTAVTEATGDFVFPAVSPGRYSVEIQANGFKRFEKRNLTITASERLAVGQVALEIGTLAESVTVTAEGTPVQVSSQCANRRHP